MAKRLIDADITDRADGKVPVWDDGTNTHRYEDPAATSGYPEGTAFPGSPSTDDKFYRTDRNRLYYYDGTRWLTTEEFTIPLATVEVIAGSSATATLAEAPVRTDFQLYITNVYTAVRLSSGTHNGTNKWVFTVVEDRDGAAGASTLVTLDTVTEGVTANASARFVKETVVNALLNTSARLLRLVATETGAPPTIRGSSEVHYRLVG
jgi:hypothetical protein